MSALFALIVTGTVGFSSCGINQIGGAFTRDPEKLSATLSRDAQSLIKQAYIGIQPEKLLDYHVHLLGLRTGNNGAFVNAEMQSLLHPIQRLKFAVYLSAAGVKNKENADREYVSRLTRLIYSRKQQGKYLLFAQDKYYNLDGSENLDLTQFYVPNNYLFQITNHYPDIFIPVVSVHPYRDDAVKTIEQWAYRGVKAIKWLPNVMGIDPSHPKTDPVYKAMQANDMVLISHVGEEQAVDTGENQRLGNPLLLRKALDNGVKVIMAHCASLGQCRDLDRVEKPDIPCFELFLRMMAEKRYEGLLFGDISSITQANRFPGHLEAILNKEALHSRLVNGSDYPLPAINILVRTSSLVDAGFITERERTLLNEIYDYNPLLFDFVLKRTVKAPHTNKQFPAAVFTRQLL